MNFISIQEPRRSPVDATGFALWQLGFRPFFLLASMFGALSIGLWAAQFAGWLPGSYLSGPLWHAHEMLFGFTLAVMVGFLLTAGRNWANRPTPTGVPSKIARSSSRSTAENSGRSVGSGRRLGRDDENAPERTF